MYVLRDGDDLMCFFLHLARWTNGILLPNYLHVNTNQLQQFNKIIYELIKLLDAHYRNNLNSITVHCVTKQSTV